MAENILKRFITHEDEKFAYIAAYPSYIVSNYGVVYSLQRKNPRQLKPNKRPNRHLTVVLHNDFGKQEKTIYKLIEDTFNTRHITHKATPKFKDGDISNFTPDNIYYDKKEFTPLPGDIIIKEGDEGAAQILTVAKKILIHLGYAKYLHGEHLIMDMYNADDLIMEIYMKVARKQLEYSGMSENFAFTIGRNFMFNLSKESNRLEVMSFDHLTQAPEMDYDNLEELMVESQVEEDMIREEQFRIISELLNEEENEFLMLKLNGFSLTEIAAELSINVMEVLKIEKEIKIRIGEYYAE